MAIYDYYITELNNRQKEERSSVSTAYSINLSGIYVFQAEQDNNRNTGVIFNYLGILAYRLKTLYRKPKRDRCCHECNLEPREQDKKGPEVN